MQWEKKRGETRQNEGNAMQRMRERLAKKPSNKEQEEKHKVIGNNKLYL